MDDNKEKIIAGLTHFFGIFLGPFPGLLVFLIRSGEGHARDQAREALNFQLTLIVLSLIGGMLIMLYIGIYILFVIYAADVILSIIAAFRSSSGEKYRYPFNIRFIKPPGGYASI